MPNKIKLVLILVAIVAVFSVYELVLYVHKIASSSSVYQGTSPLPSPDDDPDHDGLDNQQEVIWGTDPFNPDTDNDGFKDGEEVKSGHNPLIPGPKDLISQDNLTQQFSELTVAGIAEGSLKQDSPKYAQALASITGTITDSAKYIFNKEVSEDQFTIVDSSTKAAEQYLKSIAPILQKFYTLFDDQSARLQIDLDTIGNTGMDEAMQTYYSQLAPQYQSIVDEGSRIPVPKNFESAHSRILSLSLQMRSIDDAIANSNTDPIKSSFAFTALGDAYDKYLTAFQAYEDAIQKSGVDTSKFTQ